MISEETLRSIALALSGVEGIEAVALGGSRARGTDRPDSDVDLALYYDRERLDVDGLRSLARTLTGRDVDVAGPGGWGPWVDGGAWLEVEGTAVDWILRDVERVRRQRDRAVRGEFAFHHQPGHPLGFLDVSYLGEAVTCRPLADPHDVIVELRAGGVPYPEALRAAMIANLWQARFLLDAASKGAGRRDVAYVALCCSTAAMICAHAWHAAAGVWVTNEKDLVPGVARLGLDTGTFVDEVEAALRLLDADELSLRSATALMRAAVESTSSRLGRPQSGVTGRWVEVRWGNTTTKLPPFSPHQARELHDSSESPSTGDAWEL